MSKSKSKAKKMNKVEKTASLEVKRDDAIAVLRAIGFKTPHKADNAKLTSRLNRMKELMDGYDGTLNGATQELVDKFIKAEGTIKVTGAEPKGSSKSTTSGEKKAKKEAKSPRKPRTAGEPSTKEKVWKLYSKVKPENAKKQAEKWFSDLGESVKLSTIRSWIGQWAKGKNLPKCASSGQ